MNAHMDLTHGNEPRPTPDEETLANWLDQVLTEFESGNPVNPADLWTDNPALPNRGEDFVRIVRLLYECAAGISESMGGPLTEDPLVPPEESALDSTDPPYDRMQERAASWMPAAAMDNELPDPFPTEYRFLQLLGEGTFGKVYLAEDLNLGWQVAIKTLKLPATATLGPQVLAALRTEAKHLAQLDHPNIVRVHSWRETRGEYYLVMQFVTGGSLSAKLAEKGALGWEEAGRFIADIGDGLIAAHRRGVIHRDIKPDNILWDSTRNEAKLTDFGLSARLTEPGTAAGTPMYMAPEAFERRVSPALDVYGLTATLYHLATGFLPFSRAPLPNLRYQKLAGLPDPDPRLEAVPEEMERIIRIGLVGNPEGRPSMETFVDMLRASLNHLLVDALAASAVESGSWASVNLRLMVARQVHGGEYEPVAATKRAVSLVSRDMKRVPPSPRKVGLQTGDRVRIEVVVDKSGHIIVFNIGPTGTLNLLFPDDPTMSCSPIESQRPLHIVDVEMAPPVGRERVFAVWSKDPLPLRLEQLLSLVQSQGDVVTSSSYRATRDMKRVRQTIAAVPSDNWNVEVMEIEHVPR